MQTTPLTISNIPAILWGQPSGTLYIAVHGDQSHKQDTVIELFARQVTAKGATVLSFDLPEHGSRAQEPALLNPPNALADLAAILQYARTIATDIRLFACSIGAYFSMLAYQSESITQALFLSPVVDMQRLIENIMRWTNTTPQQLQAQQTVHTPIKTLYWDYYRYTIQHPVSWHTPTAILYGEKDTLVEKSTLESFATASPAQLTIIPGAEHFFHTKAQLQAYTSWLAAAL